MKPPHDVTPDFTLPESGGTACCAGASGLSVSLTAGNPVMRPRVLICGPEGAGQAHLAPALLYALEGLPVHAIGLPALLSDASARCPAAPHAVKLQSEVNKSLGMSACKQVDSLLVLRSPQTHLPSSQVMQFLGRCCNAMP